jgi:hypothetical protein
MKLDWETFGVTMKNCDYSWKGSSQSEEGELTLIFGTNRITVPMKSFKEAARLVVSINQFVEDSLLENTQRIRSIINKTLDSYE